MNKKFIAGTAASVCAFAASQVIYSEKVIKTTEYTLDTGKAAENIKVAVMSDLHFSRFGSNNVRLVEKVRRIKPDMILIAGDFFDCRHGVSNARLVIATLEAFSSVAPVYFSPGNHDKRFNAKTKEDFAEYAVKAGCKVLDGQYEDIEIKGASVRIGGIFDYDVYPEDYYERWEFSPVYKFLSDYENTDSIKLLMMHRPNTFIYTQEEWNVDAVFSGHDHGGLWRLPFVGGVYAPEQGFFPKYDKGEFAFGKMKMYLSSGLEGYYFMPRLFNPPEIMSITVK